MEILLFGMNILPESEWKWSEWILVLERLASLYESTLTFFFAIESNAVKAPPSAKTQNTLALTRMFYDSIRLRIYNHRPKTYFQVKINFVYAINKLERKYIRRVCGTILRASVCVCARCLVTYSSILSLCVFANYLAAQSTKDARTYSNRETTLEPETKSIIENDSAQEKGSQRGRGRRVRGRLARKTDPTRRVYILFLFINWFGLAIYPKIRMLIKLCACVCERRKYICFLAHLFHFFAFTWVRA